MSNTNELVRGSRWSRYLINKWALLVLVVLVGWLIWHFWHKSSATGQGEFPGFGGGRNGRNATTVGVATAEAADIPIVLNALGTVTATSTVTVRPQVSGVLQQVNFREGQMVKAGQVLAVIDPRQYELALMQSSGQLHRDEAQLDNARLVLKRDLVLQAQDSIAQQDVEAQSTLVKQLEGTVMTDRAQEGNARLNLSYTKVVAPVSGRVGLRTVDVGNLVTANDATGIAVITQLAPIDIEFTVPQLQVADIQAGLSEHHDTGAEPAKESALKVTALDRDRATVLAEGKFLALDNQVDIQTGTVRAKARFANDNQRLFPNEFVNVKLVMHTIKNAVVVPIAAMRHGGSGNYVYVLDAEASTVAQRPVTVGQADTDKVQITSGLKVGEKVITEGADRLKDGAKVNLPGAAPQQPMGANGEPRKNRQNREGQGWNGQGSNGQGGNKQAGDGQKREWHKKPEGGEGAAVSEKNGAAPDNNPSVAASSSGNSAVSDVSSPTGDAASSGSSSSQASEHRHKRRTDEQ